MNSPPPTRTGSRRERARSTIGFCLRREHLRLTLTIALVVGTILTLINHADAIFAGEATAATAVKIVANFIVPFTVANLGLLGARPPEPAASTSVRRGADS